MHRGLRSFFFFIFFAAILLAASSSEALAGATWSGKVTDSAGAPVYRAFIACEALSHVNDHQVTSVDDGEFALTDLEPSTYTLSVSVGNEEWKADAPITVKDDSPMTMNLRLAADHHLIVTIIPPEKSSQSTGGEHLSSTEVSSLPLNARDFSKLLLLAAGTMTDTNGAANFTQQFAVNGQRGVTTVFATDGFDTTDPEMGGATFSNFNVDAIQEVQGSSGVMMADTGHGAASSTNVVTKSGTNRMHGSVFEFLRNASLDARNYFDYRERRPGRSAGNLRRPRQDILFRRISGISPGAGHNSSHSRSDRQRAPGNRYDDLRRRYAHSSGECRHCAGAEWIPAAK
jgi:hypothetical protein